MSLVVPKFVISGTLCIITVRNEVAKVMFLQMSVCPRGVVSQHALQVVFQHSRSPGGCLLRGGCLLGGGVPADGYCCGRYASYWNAFLLLSMFDFSKNFSFILSNLCNRDVSHIDQYRLK